MKIQSKFFKGILVSTVCLLFSANIHAQNWDVNLLKKINPVNPHSGFWEGMSTSVYPVAAALPVGLLTKGFINNDKALQQKGWQALGAVAINVAITQALKAAVNRERPFLKYDFIYTDDETAKSGSFPSGHTSLAFATATTLTLEFKKWYVAVPAYTWAAAVGYSRMYLGQHYPSDIIGGAVVGAGSAYLSYWLNKKIFKKNNSATHTALLP